MESVVRLICCCDWPVLTVWFDILVNQPHDAVAFHLLLLPLTAILLAARKPY